MEVLTETYSLDLNLEVWIPKGYFEHIGYQDYFCMWLIRNGCLVLVNHQSNEPRIKHLNSRTLEEKPRAYLEALEECFRRDVVCK